MLECTSNSPCFTHKLVKQHSCIRVPGYKNDSFPHTYCCFEVCILLPGQRSLAVRMNSKLLRQHLVRALSQTLCADSIHLPCVTRPGWSHGVPGPGTLVGRKTLDPGTTTTRYVQPTTRYNPDHGDMVARVWLAAGRECYSGHHSVRSVATISPWSVVVGCGLWRVVVVPGAQDFPAQRTWLRPRGTTPRAHQTTMCNFHTIHTKERNVS